MVQQLYGDLEKVKTEIRRLRGELRRIALGGTLIATNGAGSPIPTPIFGSIIVGTIAPEWGRLGIGNSKEVLTVDGGTADWLPPAVDEVYLINMAAAL